MAQVNVSEPLELEENDLHGGVNIAMLDECTTLHGNTGGDRLVDLLNAHGVDARKPTGQLLELSAGAFAPLLSAEAFAPLEEDE